MLEKEVEDIAPLVTLLIRNVVLVRKCFRLFGSVNLLKINTTMLLNRVRHGKAYKRLAKIDLHIVVHNLCGTQYLLCNSTNQLLGDLHHAVVISICLVQLKQCKFGVVAY